MAEFRPYARLAVFTGAICSAISAGLFITVDVGNPARAWRILTSFRFASPVLWDTLILAAYVIIGVIFTRDLILVEQGKKKEGSLKVIAVIAFVAGLLVTATSFIFSMWTARPLWNSPVQPLSFLAAAMVISFAVLAILLTALNKSGYISISGESVMKLGKLAAAFLLVELAVVASEVALGLYAAESEVGSLISWMVVGAGAPYFWVEIACMIAGALLLFGAKPGMTVAGAAFALAAMFLIKYNFLQAQLLNPLISAAGPDWFSARAAVYLPTLVEVLVAVGILSLGGLLVTLGLSGLPLGSRQGEAKA
jgi:molybdopterin-containing oxidoreductase family membrane subunit